ncbi:MAG: outer membrane beta-barrel protein [Salibacteraceae bacterium]
MKQVFILFIFLATVGSSLLAQEGEKTEPRNKHQDHMIIDLGYETFTSRPGFTNFEWYNNGLNIQIFYDKLFGQSGISGAIGIGFSTQSYYSDKQIRRDSTKDYNYSDWLDPEREYNRNKVSTSWVEVPLELRYRSDIDDWGYRWKFSVGGKVGFLFDTHDKLVDKNDIKYKTYYFPDMNNVRFGLIARAGYGKVNFSTFFSLTEFFVPGRGPEMKQVSVAISLVPF